MEEAAQERSQRLKALKEAAKLCADSGEQDGQQGGAAAAEEEDATEEAGAVRFRNYVPRDEELQKLKREPPLLPKFEDMIANNATEAARTEDPIVSIAPKKANWDLRRDIAKKLDKLEKRTLRSMIQLMPAEKENRKQLGLE